MPILRYQAFIGYKESSPYVFTKSCPNACEIPGPVPGQTAQPGQGVPPLWRPEKVEFQAPGDFFRKHVILNAINVKKISDLQ